MINEELFLEEIINKKRQYKGDDHYLAQLFAKKYQPSGANVNDIRIKIEEWVRDAGILITCDINYDIMKVLSSKHGFDPFSPIPITRRDVNFINSISTGGRRRVMFALMILAKRYGDKMGNFYVPINTFSEWVGFANSSNLYTRHFPWLIKNKYIENMTARYRDRGYIVSEGSMVFKFDYLLFKDDTEVLFEIVDNDFDKSARLIGIGAIEPQVIKK